VSYGVAKWHQNSSTGKKFSNQEFSNLLSYTGRKRVKGILHTPICKLESP